MDSLNDKSGNVWMNLSELITSGGKLCHMKKNN